MRAVMPAVVAVALALLPLGCGSSGTTDASVPVVSVTSPAAYVAEVQESLKPPGRMASLLSDQARAGTFTIGRGELDALVGRARGHLETLRAMRLTSPALRRQRDAFTGAYTAVVTLMASVADAVGRGDPAEVANTSRPFFASLRGLSSAVSPPS